MREPEPQEIVESEVEASVVGRTAGAWHLGYQPALDGVRALAVSAVLVFHLHDDVFSLGGFGVDVFFVLSGFLITLLLLQEHRAEGRIRFAKFYARRALRLLPVLYAALLVVALHAAFVKTGDRSDTFFDVGFGAVYLKNWEVLLHPTTETGPLVHLWSLSLEEQFYLFWPPILAFVLARGWLRGARVVALGGFAVLALTRLLATPDPTTLAGQRADALLLGCAAGITMHLFRRRDDATGAGEATGAGDAAAARSRVAGWAPPAALVTLLGLAAALLLPIPWRFSDVVQRVGITLVAVAAAVLISSIVLAPQALAARVLAVKPLVLIGRISYGLYVWHLIVYKLTPPKLLPGNRVLADVMLIVYSLLVAVASFLLIERPALRLKARLRVGPEARDGAPA